ncbi:S-adenosyl-L-methionine-dependent methyltransferase, partial [Blyttiomyces helicus]
MASALGQAHVPFGADGSGLYSLATLGCFDVILACRTDVLTSLPSRIHGVFRIADYGPADGGTSLALFNEVIDAALANGASTITISYIDQPNNDWKSLFFHAGGQRRIGDIPPLSDHPNVFYAAIGRSFHTQCVPPASLDLAISFTAMHWLSRKPCDISTGVHATQASVARERDAFAAQAAADWDAILVARAAELVLGGRFVVANFTVSPDGEWLGHTAEVPECMFMTFDAIWGEMCREGRIGEEERLRATFINYYRSEEELIAPFRAGGAAFGAGLRVVSCRFLKTP